MDKNLFKRSLLAALFGASLFASTAAYSDIVFDPSNFVKNTITAGQQVKQTAVQLAIKAEEVKQYMLMVQDLKQLNPNVIQRGVSRGIIPPGAYTTPAQVANAAKGVYGVYESIGNNMNDYDTSYNGINTVMKDLDRTSAKANVSPDKILQYDFQRAQQGQAQDNNYYLALKNLNGQISQHQRRTDELAAAIPAQSGTVELLQTIGTQNTVVQDQLSHLIQVNSIAAAKIVQNSKDQELRDELEARKKADGANTEAKAGSYFAKKTK